MMGNCERIVVIIGLILVSLFCALPSLIVIVASIARQLEGG